MFTYYAYTGPVAGGAELSRSPRRRPLSPTLPRIAGIEISVRHPARPARPTTQAMTALRDRDVAAQRRSQRRQDRPHLQMSRRRPDLASENGVALLVVLMAMAAGTMLAAVALAAAGADLPFAKESQDRKQAYAAAEAGLEYYLFQLSENNDYWTLVRHRPRPESDRAEPGEPALDTHVARPRRTRGAGAR